MMKRDISPALLLIAVALFCVCCPDLASHAAPTPDEPSKEAADKIYDDLFTDKKDAGIRLEPAETKELLEKLDRMDSALAGDKKRSLRTRKVKSLLKAAERSDDCSRDTFTDLGAIQSNFYDRPNLARFLDEQLADQYDRCKDKLSNQLKSKLEDLDEQQKADAERLLELTNEATATISAKLAENEKNPASAPGPASLYDDQYKYAKVAYEFMNEKFDNKLAEQSWAKHSSKFILQFNQSIGQVCHAVMSLAGDSMRTFDILINSPHVVARMDPFTVDWSMKLMMCDYIVDNSDQIAYRIHKAMRTLAKGNQTKNFLRSLFDRGTRSRQKQIK